MFCSCIIGNEIREDATVSINKLKSESHLCPLPLLDISNTNTPQSSPQLSPTKIEEGWFVAPPPCFVVNCPNQLEVSPLENLLIEHPSMSVYGRLPDYLKDKKTDEKAQENAKAGAVPISNAVKKPFERTTELPGWEVEKVPANPPAPNDVQKPRKIDLKSMIIF